jgi:diphosphoinositol-polyphosphate diphosphatase
MNIGGIQGIITKYVTTVNTPTATIHFYEMDVTKLDDKWPESKERLREWVDYTEACRRLTWKPELLQGLMLCSLASKR